MFFLWYEICLNFQGVVNFNLQGNMMKFKSLGLIFAAVLAFGSASTASATVITSTNVPVVICDLCTVTSTLNVDTHMVITDIDALINNLLHTFDNDLDIKLTHNAISVWLTTDNGGGADNYIRTVFSDQAAVSVIGAVAPFTGVFRPEELLSAFNGQDAFGIWTLTITDDLGADVGTLNSWGIDITSRSVPEPTSIALLGLGLFGFAVARRRKQ